MDHYRTSLALFLCVLIGGCGSSRGVSVVSHGEQEFPRTQKSEPTEPVVSPLIISKDPVTPEPVKPALPSVQKEKANIPDMDSSPTSGNADIFAQSAISSSLPMVLGDVFFDYDQMAIRSDAKTTLEQNAKILMARFTDRKIVIEGHCDERGTEEYNLILGKRRAMAVKGYLSDLGVPSSNLTIISFGKSKPFCQERTHECLQQNRRAHFSLQ